MKALNVVAAGLGYRLLERSGLTEMAGLRFSPAASVFPAVTCVAQATLRTGHGPDVHGMISNGVWIDCLRKPMFWEQSCRFVQGPRIWGPRDGVFFFQQSLGENVGLILSPAPIHKHGGGMVMSCYTKPTDCAVELESRCGKFPLWRYWGPLASPRVGRKCIEAFETMTRIHDVDNAYLYLPSLDYAAQKYGPLSRQAQAALLEFRSQLEYLADLCQKRGCALKVSGDYEITAVTADSVRPNVVLRRAGFFRVRSVGGRTYPDFFQSNAFAMCDHEFCVVYGDKYEQAADLLLATGEYELPPKDDLMFADSVGFRILLARSGSWCEYKWWTDNREAPDFASHVDIHNKPGYDPTELFFMGRGTVRGTHGRKCEVACA